MQRLFGAAAYLAAMILAGPVLAQSTGGDVPGKASVGVTAGSLGVGPEIGYRFDRHVGARVNGGFLGLDHSFRSGGIDYDGHAKLSSVGAIVDLYPFGGGFRVSAGARYNGTDGNVRATPDGPTRIGSLVFTPEQIGTITGQADLRAFAPQLTLGYGGKLRKGLAFTVEAGALFQGAVRIRDFTSNGTLASDPTIAGATYRRELANQRQTLQDTANDYQVYPILQFGLKYRF
ncbi:hypothetical protein S2M10_38050 [Sphingomonas sp. S2M10]|uniref:hypothetical protein n=1 Tax=Sphingomonas sp. S2M10 TaxID=2705010 RepID=UPI0014572A75|nr:hypothetical protein [Sphingomonas sp. S2M10]NLS28793.1 hypothetical protein [Sphingomonas sp. S2M10]